MDNYNKRLCVINVNDQITDTEYALRGHQKKTIALHRAFSVFIFNSKNELLVQKRAQEKLVFPGKLANTCCSHPFINELSFTDPVLDCKIHAVKRLKYELGVDLNINDLVFFDRLYYYADETDSFCKFMGRNIESQSVDFGILDKKLCQVPIQFDTREFVEHEIDYLFYCVKDLEYKPRPTEVEEIMYVDEQGMKDMAEDPMCAPWLKMASSNIDLFKLAK